MRGPIVCAVVAAVCCSGPALATSTNPHLERAKKLLDRFKEREALQALHKAEGAAAGHSATLARVHMYRGLAFANLFARRKSRAAFRQALLLERGLNLPAGTSPKIRAVFESVRKTLPPSPPTPAQAPPPPTQRAASPPDQSESAAESSPASPVIIDDAGIGEEDGRQGSTNWAAWLTLAGSVVVAGVGLGLGVAAKSEADTAADQQLPWPDAEPHHSNAEDLALGANFMFGAAAFGAIIAGVLFLVNHDGGATDDVGEDGAEPGGSDGIEGLTLTTSSTGLTIGGRLRW